MSSECPQCSSGHEEVAAAVASNNNSGQSRTRDQRSRRRRRDDEMTGESRTESHDEGRRRRRSRRRRSGGCSAAASSSETRSRRQRQNGSSGTRSHDDRRRRRRRRQQQQQQTTSSSNHRVQSTTRIGPEEEATKSQIRKWPHDFSFASACLSCTVSFVGISRFAVLTIHLGAVFMFQFVLLSVAFGIPMMTFFACLGQYLGSGVVDMWRISPIFQGVGISLILTLAMYSVANVTNLAWIFIFLRDSFVTSFNSYKWTNCFPVISYQRFCEEKFYNGTAVGLEETIPDYFNGVVLLRSTPGYPDSFTGELRFQTLFNVIVVWMAIFIGLSKGLKSYGKVAVIFGLLPTLGFLVFCSKVIGLVSNESFQRWFFSSNWEDFTHNAQSWVIAGRECFFTWIFLGAIVAQLTSHNHFRHNLLRDILLISVVTLTVLTLSGLLGVAVVQIINEGGFQYRASSFESARSYEFLKPHPTFQQQSHREARNLVPPGMASAYKSEDVTESGSITPLLFGIRIQDQERDPKKYSGYQAMRLSTELVPTLAAILGPEMLSPFWIVLFYFSMVLYSLSQHFAIFNTVVGSLIAIQADKLLDFETALTFVTCVIGISFSIPMATEIGIFVIYFVDYVIGGAWFLILLYLTELFAIFVIRGRPYSGEQIASVLFKSGSGRDKKSCFAGFVIPVFVFLWSILIPIALIILGIASFQLGHFEEMFDWASEDRYKYMPAWVREIGAMFQILPLVLVPFVAVVQAARYFLGPHDFHEQLNMLYRPSFIHQVSNQFRSSASQRNVVLTNYSSSNSGHHSSSSGFSGNSDSQSSRAPEDPPPKYTPPPSYSTATGARIARFLRQSFRQSVRRLRELTSANAHLAISSGHETSDGKPENPPDYASVMIENDIIASSPAQRRSLSGIQNGGFTTDTSSDVHMDSFINNLMPPSSISVPTFTSCTTTFSTLSDHQPRSLGGTLVHSNSFRLQLRDTHLGSRVAPKESSPDDADIPSIMSFQSDAILVRSAEPIDRLPTPPSCDDEDEDDALYMNPKDETSTDDVSIDIDRTTEGKIDVIIPENALDRDLENETVVLNVDTSASVI